MIHSTREVISLLKKDGWYNVVTHSGHRHFKHKTKKGKVSVPRGRKDIPKGTYSNILRQAGLK